MAANVVPRFFEFDADTDEWEVYRARLEQHFVVNGVTDKKIQVAVLLSSISQATYKLLRDLAHPTPPQEKTFDQLSELLQTQFGVPTSSWRERIKFYELSQGTLSIADWHAKVRGMAASCDFGQDLIKILKDKFVTGLNPGKILDRLCEEVVKDLDHLFSVAMKAVAPQSQYK